MNKVALIDLMEVLERHKIEIWGCGCCGSPSLEIDGQCVNDSENINKETIENLIESMENKQ